MFSVNVTMMKCENASQPRDHTCVRSRSITQHESGHGPTRFTDCNRLLTCAHERTVHYRGSWQQVMKDSGGKGFMITSPSISMCDWASVGKYANRQPQINATKPIS